MNTFSLVAGMLKTIISSYRMLNKDQVWEAAKVSKA